MKGSNQTKNSVHSAASSMQQNRNHPFVKRALSSTLKPLDKKLTWGFDFFGTITANRRVYISWMKALTLAGNKVYIISAVDREENHARMQQIRSDRIPKTKTFIVVTSTSSEAPYKKYQLAKKLGVDVFVDDRADVIEYFRRRGIYGLIAFPDNFDKLLSTRIAKKK